MKPAYGRPDPADASKRATCYVCGSPRCAEYPLAIRQQAAGPYFPFLETHEPPDGSEPPSADGRVLSCFLCYSYLTQQWDLYERDKVPPVKRIYWLKRVDNGPYTGVEVGVQSEYASQLLGLAPDPPAADSKRAGASGAARVQPPPTVATAAPTAPVEPKRARIVPPQPQPPTMPLPPPGVPPLPLGIAVPQLCPQQEALDLRMPDKNAPTEVCYVCGAQHKKGTLVGIFAKQSGACPFFPSLMLHPRPSKSHPMEASGRVQACRDCFSHLQLQWDAYEAHKVPHDERNYSLRRRAPPQEAAGFVCYKCGRECPSSSLCLMYCRPNADKEPFYPFIQRLEAPEGASPISPQGMVQVCSHCCKTIPQEQKMLQEKEESARVRPAEAKGVAEGVTGPHGGGAPTPAATPPSQAAVGRGASDGELPEEAVCYLCHQPHKAQVMHWLSMVLDPKNPEAMYFLFLKYQPRASQGTVIEDGRVLVCALCHQHLSAQWAEYQRENVPLEHRQFSLRHMPMTSQSPRLTPHSSPGISTPTDASPSHPFAPAVPASATAAAEPHSRAAENCGAGGGWTGQPLHALEVVPADHDPNIPTLPVITTQRALNVAINCFICSFHSKPGQTYAVRCKPRSTEPFFPFLAKHQSAHPEARVDEAYVLVCLCCFHSLILQWQRYEKAQVDHYARLYDTYNYTCYICSLKTYRKRLYLLPVKDYPFLKEHNRPPGGMVVDNGHSVVVCKDCYSSLKNQYIELERWGVPVEKRQYNWIQRPPPPEFHRDSSATGPKPVQGQISGAQPQLADPGVSSPGSHPGTPPGGLSQPRGGGSPRGSLGPPPGSSSAADDGVESRVTSGKVSEEPASSTSSTIPKTSTVVTGPVATTSDASCDGTIPSCCAPLQLKIGVARQGGKPPHALTQQSSVAASEGVNSGDASAIRSPPVDQLTHWSQKPKRNGAWERLPPIKASTHHQLLEDQKSRQSVIRGFSSPGVPSESDSRPQLSPHHPKQLLSPPHELQAKCS